MEIDCAVLDGGEAPGIRVLSRRKFQRAIGQNETSHAKDIVQEGIDVQLQTVEIPYFLSAHNLRDLLTPDVLTICAPLWFRLPNGVLAAGYRAELLPEVCDLYLTARDK